MSQPKLRRGVKPQPHHRFSVAKTIPPATTTINNNPTNSTSKFTLPKRSSPESPGIQAKYITRMPNNNVTKHFVSTDVNSSLDNHHHHHLEKRNSSSISSQSQAIQNYLNQTLLIPSNIPQRIRRPPARNSRTNGSNERTMMNETLASFNCSQVSKHPVTNHVNLADNHRQKSAITRSQSMKNSLRHNVVQKPTVAVRAMRSLSSYSQNHGVITASAYKDLRNGTIRW